MLAAEIRKVRGVVVLTMLGCLLLCNGEEVDGGAVWKGAMGEFAAMLELRVDTLWPLQGYVAVRPERR